MSHCGWLDHGGCGPFWVTFRDLCLLRTSTVQATGDMGDMGDIGDIGDMVQKKVGRGSKKSSEARASSSPNHIPISHRIQSYGRLMLTFGVY